MFRFEYHSYLFLIWLLPAVLVIYILYLRYRKHQKSKLGKIELIDKIMSEDLTGRRHVKISMLMVLLAALVLALANPQWGTKTEKVIAQSSDVFIALDISQSMMAEDISPNRLERAKRLAQNIVTALKGNRIGLILFAGNAYLQMPLTSDYSAALLFLSSANTNQATTQGTAISEAIDLALRTFEEDKPYQRAMIIITDGENHDDEALEAASRAREYGLNIHTIGVGTSEGAFVPYRAQSGRQYKKDDQGNLVKSIMNPQLIDNIASSAGGSSYLIGEGNSIILGIKKSIERLEKEQVEQRAFTDYNSYFQYLLFGALLALLLYYVIPDTRARLI
jgi:Mg-chelatase subunit ChlD